MHGGEKKIKKEKGSDSRCYDSRKSLVRELKLVYAIRAMCGYQNQNFSSKFKKGRGFSYIGYFLPSGHVKAILVQL